MVESPGREKEASDEARPSWPALPPSQIARPLAPLAASHQRRNLLWYGALVLTAIVVLGGFGLMYGDDVSWQHQATDLRTQNQSLHEQLLTSQTNLSDAQHQIGTLQDELQHPHLGLWNVPQDLKGADWYLAGGVPDTFTYHLRATSNGQMNVSILTFEQFAAAIECVDGGAGNTDYCMHHSSKGTVQSWLSVTSVSYDFHLSEGCADYLVVFTAPRPVTVSPDVSVTYNPASTFTGSCS
jgi:hypothetical protein